MTAPDTIPTELPDMPKAIHRARRGMPKVEVIEVELQTITPILGGAPVTRKVDDVDFIRVPTIRGHLRFWWRALQRRNFLSAEEMYAEEARLWGKAADDNGGRSSVEILLADVKQQQTISAPINGGNQYALWPADEIKKTGEPKAKMTRAGVQFTLSCRVPDTSADMEVRNAIRAWILFGGYGSRTRRGVGSLTVGKKHRKEWLPNLDEDEPSVGEKLAGELTRLFGTDVFASRPSAAPYPALAGATLLVGEHHWEKDKEKAWETAIGWLRNFRQGQNFARDPGPGQSRWPEADKLRHISRRDRHSVRYTDPTPVWPRAEFGLPIVGRFKDAVGPESFTLTWADATGKAQDRMASPLIIKALPTLGRISSLCSVVWARNADWSGRGVGGRWKNVGIQIEGLFFCLPQQPGSERRRKSEMDGPFDR